MKKFNNVCGHCGHDFDGEDCPICESSASPACSTADCLTIEDIFGWADGVIAALGTEDLVSRVSEVEAETASEILKIAHRRNYSF